MRSLIKTGLIAGFASGVICLIIGIVAKLIGEGFATINPGGYTRLAATILLSAIALGVYEILQRKELIRLIIRDESLLPERPGRRQTQRIRLMWSETRSGPPEFLGWPEDISGTIPETKEERNMHPIKRLRKDGAAK